MTYINLQQSWALNGKSLSAVYLGQNFWSQFTKKLAEAVLIIPFMIIMMCSKVIIIVFIQIIYHIQSITTIDKI